jgi:hypothetical protein
MSAQRHSPADDFNASARREGWPTLCDPLLAFDDARLAALLDIWRVACAGRPLPRREDFSARMLARHLANLAFVERMPGTPGRYRFRLFGSGLARYTGDCSGKILDEVMPAAFLPSWCATFDTPLAARAPMRFVSQLLAFKLDYVTTESLIAPLCNADGVPCGLLASAIYTPRVA